MRQADHAGLWAVIIATGAVLILGESVIIALFPASSGPIVQDATLLAGVGVSTFATMRSILKTRQETEKNSEQLQTISRNVNGNLSRLIDYAKRSGYDPQLLEEIDASRLELEVQMQKRKAKPSSLYE